MGLQQKAQTRVSIKNDAGYTRADGSGNKYICLYFARGCCPKGWVSLFAPRSSCCPLHPPSPL